MTEQSNEICENHNMSTILHCFALLLCFPIAVVGEFIVRSEPGDPQTPLTPQYSVSVCVALHLYPLTPPGPPLTCKCSNLQSAECQS